MEEEEEEEGQLVAQGREGPLQHLAFDLQLLYPPLHPLRLQLPGHLPCRLR